MARGMVNGEKVVSQASTDSYREGHDRSFGDSKPQRGRWVMTPQGLVPAEDYRPPAKAINAPIIADRIHEGTTYDHGDRVVDLGSRRKRREFMRETGVVETSDVSKSWLESRAKDKERNAERGVDRAFDEAARKLHYERKLRD